MGSFTSAPAVREDCQDLDFEVGSSTTRETLLNRCLSELPTSVPLITRNFVTFNTNHMPSGSEDSEVVDSWGVKRVPYISQGMHGPSLSLSLTFSLVSSDHSICLKPDS